MNGVGVLRERKLTTRLPSVQKTPRQRIGKLLGRARTNAGIDPSAWPDACLESRARNRITQSLFAYGFSRPLSPPSFSASRRSVGEGSQPSTRTSSHTHA